MYDKKIICAYLYIITKYGYPPPAKDTVKYIREMKDLGFKSIELEGVRENHLSEMYDLRFEIKDELNKLDLSLPYFCAVLPGLTSPDKSERNRQLKLFEKGCEIAKTFGSDGILDNAPLPPYVFPENIPVVRHYDENVIASAAFPGNLSWSEFWDYLAGTLREACDIASAYGLTYQLHPSIGVLSSNTDGFLYLNDAVKRDNLRFNLDTANQFAMKENLSLSLRRLAGFIDYIHISDNRGCKVEHLKIGEGNINWRVFMDTLKEISFTGYMGLDIGGEESEVDNLNEAYISSANWLNTNIYG